MAHILLISIVGGLLRRHNIEFYLKSYTNTKPKPVLEPQTIQFGAEWLTATRDTYRAGLPVTYWNQNHFPILKIPCENLHCLHWNKPGNGRSLRIYRLFTQKGVEILVGKELNN